MTIRRVPLDFGGRLGGHDCGPSPPGNNHGYRCRYRSPIPFNVPDPNIFSILFFEFRLVRASRSPVPFAPIVIIVHPAFPPPQPIPPDCEWGGWFAV